MKLLLVLCLFCPALAWADDVVICNPNDLIVPGRVTEFYKTVDGASYMSNPNAKIWKAPNTTHTSQEIADFNTLRTALDAMATVPMKYQKCNGNVPVEMSAAEKAAVDAPAQAEAAVQAGYDTEIAGNDWCTATLAELDTRINTVRDGLNTDIAGVTNIASARTVMTTMNNTYAAGFKKVARCLRARAR